MDGISGWNWATRPQRWHRNTAVGLDGGLCVDAYGQGWPYAHVVRAGQDAAAGKVENVEQLTTYSWWRRYRAHWAQLGLCVAQEIQRVITKLSHKMVEIMESEISRGLPSGANKTLRAFVSETLVGRNAREGHG